MSEFPEWLERKMGVWWDPSYEEAQEVHRKLRTGELTPETETHVTREIVNEWYRHLRGRLSDSGEP